MTHLQAINNKIFYRFSEFEKTLNYYRFKNFTKVFSNGCFDIIHLGHIEYLSKAADLGDVLIVGLNNDESVRKIKGNNRPISDIHSRSKVLASLSFVSAVVIFEEETPYNLIKFIKPDILVKGKDYTTENIVGADIVIENGGQVVTIDLVEGYSTTLIENKLSGNK
jgi:D-glycero-beta-D-manno-heptose 1-phosphate adenylyltransferase